MRKIQVLIVDDNQDTRDGTRRLLEYEDDIEIVDFAENGAVAIERVREQQPDVILMDINMPVMDGITATQHIHAEFPRVQIVVVSVQDDANYLKEAIRAGAVDFVTKPISADELAGAIRRAYAKKPTEAAAQKAPASQMPSSTSYSYAPAAYGKNGHVITVLGPKGGVGKTTIAVNLGIGLIRSDPDKSVLIIDADPYFGDVAVFLNTRGPHTLVDMAKMAEVPEEIDHASVDSILVTHESGVKLLISPSSLSEGNLISPGSVANMLEYFRQRFDYIIVDTSTSVDTPMIESIQSADRVVLLTTATMPSLKNARVMLGELSTVSFPLDRVILVLNAYDPNGRITAEQIAKFLRITPQIEIPVDPTTTEAMNRGLPLIQLDARRVPSVRPMKELVNLIRQTFERVEVVEEPEPEPKPRRAGLFSSLFGG